MRKQSPVHDAGFTLVEMAIVLVIIGLAAGMLLTAGTAMLDNQKRKAVRAQLETLDNALARFVAVNKRLPCPADGISPTGSSGAGMETVLAGACSPVNQQRGVVPWVTLALTEADVIDPWGGRITYRVDPALAASTLLMNMSNCDPSSTGPATGGICITPTLPCTGTAGCTSPANFLANKGLDVWDGLNGAAGFAARQNNRVTGSGAAYVLISHGPTGTGAYNHSGVLQTGSAITSLREEPNLNNTTLALPATESTVYRDAPLNDRDTLYVWPPGPVQPARTEFLFDDYLSHPTIMAVLSKANLGPRAH
jgi:prepilin-type N-terminal cleavage/methylation domain-containing protein